MNLDYEQYKMVKEALHERSTMLAIAPHLTHPLPIMLPIYQYVLARNNHRPLALLVLTLQRIYCLLQMVAPTVLLGRY